MGMGGLGERKKGDIGASTEELVINKPARNQFLTHTPEGSAGLSCLACSDRSFCISPLLLRLSMSPSSPTCARPASLLLPPGRRAVADSDTPLSAGGCSLSCAREAPPLLHLWHIAGTCDLT